MPLDKMQARAKGSAGEPEARRPSEDLAVISAHAHATSDMVIATAASCLGVPSASSSTPALAPRLEGLRPADLAYCTALLRAGSKSFASAARLLPVRVRPQVTAFYAFCRVADDAIDDSDDPARALVELHGRVDAVYAGHSLDNPVDRALAWVVQVAAIPRPLIDTLLEGFAWDLEKCRYEHLEETLAYSARVASVVGVVMTLIMGARERQTLARACDLGVAMQLTNIARDVGEDALRGRLYLPGSWLREEGVDPEAFMRDPTPSPGVQRATARLLGHAEGLYARAQAGIPALPRDCRPAIRAAALIYADIGRAIARRGFDSVTGRAHTSAPRKLWLLARAWLGAVRADAAAWHEPPLPEVVFLVDAVRRPALALGSAV
jgi:15-cis-phytoene synthase